MKILLTGATGFVGSVLVKKLKNNGHDLVVLSRNKEKAKTKLSGVEVFEWDYKAGAAPSEAFKNIDGVIHLMGENIGDGRWTEAKKKRILDSRVLGSKNLIDGLKASGENIKFFVSTSAVGIYGVNHHFSTPLDESSPLGNDYLANVCKQWEESVTKNLPENVKLNIVRVGVVFGKGGGALAKMELPFKLGGGGVMGSGNQIMSWIHIDDLTNLYVCAAENEDLTGIINATAPEPVSNKEFTKIFGKVLSRPTIFPMPSFAAKLVFGEMSTIILDGQKVVPRKALDYSFEFNFANLKAALENIYKS